MRVLGIVLAAGAGRRMGRPKALVRADDGTPWVVLAVRALVDGGCSPVLVVLGAAADEAAALVPAPAVVVHAPDWADGMSASLRAGLAAATAITADAGTEADAGAKADAGAEADAGSEADAGAEAAVVTLVDTPGVTGAAVARLISAGSDLARAGYHGRPGHPVLLGRSHWPEIIATLHGDSGARAYLSTHPPTQIECADIATGTDIDTPPTPPSPP